MKTNLHLLVACILASALWAQTLPLAQTGQTVSYAAGDDGDTQRGVEPPEPRFTDHGDGTVTDNLTGLMWVKAPHSLDGNPDRINWADALDFCNDLEYAGYDDWVLPNVREMDSLIDSGNHSPALPDEHPFTGLRGLSYPYYWTSSSHAGDNSYAWAVDVFYGSGSPALKAQNNLVSLWPVRSGQ